MWSRVCFSSLSVFGLHHLRRETSVCLAVVGSSMFTRQPLTVSVCCLLLGRSCSAPLSDENSWDWTTQEMCCKIKTSSYKRLKSSTELQRRRQTQWSHMIHCHYILSFGNLLFLSGPGPALTLSPCSFSLQLCGWWGCCVCWHLWVRTVWWRSK